MKSRPQRSEKYAVLFGLLCLGALAAAAVAPSWPVKIINGNAALAFGGVALGYGVLGTRVFGKRSAKLPLWSGPIYWPYFALNYLSLWLFRRASRENIVDEIVPGLWLGCRLWPRDEKRLPAILSVLDLTAEFSEVPFLRKAPHYLCVPVLDTTAPTLEELARGVQFIKTHHPRGTVYVHCALGHGRSATFATAYLLATGHSKTIDEALRHLREVRPGVDLHLPQQKLLERYLLTLSSSHYVS